MDNMACTIEMPLFLSIGFLCEGVTCFNDVNVVLFPSLNLYALQSFVDEIVPKMYSLRCCFLL